MRLLLTFLIVLSLAPSARADGNRGIRFFRGTWQEACRVAAEEGKLVFADFYTRWCGPCLHMAEEVFPLSFVGDFYNEHFVCVKIDALVRERDYDAADAAIREAMADTLVDQAFIDQFRYTVRSACWRGDTPLSWLSRCASYMQYIAYNDDDRQDASIHQEYAALLERLIRLAPGAEEVFPASILDKPEFGVQDYSLRPRNLAPKPAGKAAGG